MSTRRAFLAGLPAVALVAAPMVAIAAEENGSGKVPFSPDESLPAAVVAAVQRYRAAYQVVADAWSRVDRADLPGPRWWGSSGPACGPSWLTYQDAREDLRRVHEAMIEALAT